VTILKQNKKAIAFDMLSREEKKNISIKGGEVHIKTGGNSKKRTSEVKRMNPKRKVISSDVTQVPAT
jgi:hypothetical protein